MSTAFYEFGQQLSKGEAWEKILDRHFSQWFAVQPVSLQAQKWGMDRVWTSKADGSRNTVEYKSDNRAHETGNVFIETTSQDTRNILGWAWTSCAQMIVYYLPGTGYAYLIPVLTLRSLILEWAAQYPKGHAQNNGYQTVGVLVPLEEFAKHCRKTKVA